MCQTPSKRRTDGQTRTATTSTTIAAVTRRVDVAATRRPCQDTNEQTDRQTPGIEFGAPVTSGGNNFNEFPDN